MEKFDLSSPVQSPEERFTSEQIEELKKRGMDPGALLKTQRQAEVEAHTEAKKHNKAVDSRLSKRPDLSARKIESQAYKEYSDWVDRRHGRKLSEHESLGRRPEEIKKLKEEILYSSGVTPEEHRANYQHISDMDAMQEKARGERLIEIWAEAESKKARERVLADKKPGLIRKLKDLFGI